MARGLLIWARQSRVPQNDAKKGFAVPIVSPEAAAPPQWTYVQSFAPDQSGTDQSSEFASLLDSQTSNTSADNQLAAPAATPTAPIAAPSAPAAAPTAPATAPTVPVTASSGPNAQ